MARFCGNTRAGRCFWILTVHVTTCICDALHGSTQNYAAYAHRILCARFSAVSTDPVS